MSEEEETQAFNEYMAFEGEQGFFQKVHVVFLNRLRMFYRSGYQWAILFTPLLYILLQLLIIFAVL